MLALLVSLLPGTRCQFSDKKRDSLQDAKIRILLSQAKAELVLNLRGAPFYEPGDFPGSFFGTLNSS